MRAKRHSGNDPDRPVSDWGSPIRPLPLRIPDGALKDDEAQRLKALEKEHSRSKKIVAEQVLLRLRPATGNW
jgi:hypothetical protein